MAKHHAPPPNAYDYVFHKTATAGDAPIIWSFTGKLEIGFTVPSTEEVNSSTLLQGGDQIISWPNGIPATKEDIDLYFKHKVAKDGVRGKMNITMSKSIGQMKENTSIFRTYLKQEQVYVSQASLGIVDARLVGFFLQAEPNITSHKDLKQAIMEVMADGTPISVFPKRVKEPSNDSFTNGLAVQVAIPDTKKAAEYTETLAKEIEYFKSNDSHPILSSKVCMPFGNRASIDNVTFHKLILMQNEYLRKIRHIDIHHLCNIDK
jgi:hypothetical protein